MNTNFEIGDKVEIIDHHGYITGKIFTIKNIRKCDRISISCLNCPGLIEFEELPGRNHCYGYNLDNENRYLCKHANFKLDLPI